MTGGSDGIDGAGPLDVAIVHHRTVDVDGVRMFYRESSARGGVPLLLLHGFPSSSFQFRRLMDVLGTRHHLIAPDYPGSGFTWTPPGYVYSFDALADSVNRFVEELALERFVLYLFDFGGPVGFRLALDHPERVAGLIVQNANAYEAGLSDAARGLVAERPDVDGSDGRARAMLGIEATRGQYRTGAHDVSRIPPESWTVDQHFLDEPGRADAQVALMLDYHTNVEQYPLWQRWLRDHLPPALIVWGRHDPLFLEAGARAYLADLPDAELHLFDTGHFALEEQLPEIAPVIDRFLVDVAAADDDRQVSPTERTRP